LVIDNGDARDRHWIECCRAMLVALLMSEFQRRRDRESAECSGARFEGRVVRE
jgi:hypothetical protein